MKIKDYLSMVENLPKLPFYKEKIEKFYVDQKIKIEDCDIESTNVIFNTIQFKQVSYTDINGSIKYRWSVNGNPKIDYRVDNIHIKTTNGLIYATITDLLYRHGFKNYSVFDTNRNSCYIDFKNRFWSLDNDRFAEYHCIDDDEIIYNIFFESLNEYPNGVPLIWED